MEVLLNNIAEIRKREPSLKMTFEIFGSLI